MSMNLKNGLVPKMGSAEFQMGGETFTLEDFHKLIASVFTKHRKELVALLRKNGSFVEDKDDDKKILAMTAAALEKNYRFRKDFIALAISTSQLSGQIMAMVNMDGTRQWNNITTEEDRENCSNSHNGKLGETICRGSRDPEALALVNKAFDFFSQSATNKQEIKKLDKMIEYQRTGGTGISGDYINQGQLGTGATKGGIGTGGIVLIVVGVAALGGFIWYMSKNKPAAPVAAPVTA